MSQPKIKSEHVPKINKVSDLPVDEKALMDCKQTRDNIKKELKLLDSKKNNFREKAKSELKANNKTKAKLYLNRSKLLEKRYEVYNGQLTMIEEKINSIQTMKMQKDAITVLQQGNQVLKELNKEVSVKKWEEIKDDMDSMKQEQDEIAALIKGYGIDEVKYNEELDRDLDKLIEAENPKLKLPDAPKGKVEIAKESEEDEIDNKHVQVLA